MSIKMSLSRSGNTYIGIASELLAYFDYAMMIITCFVKAYIVLVTFN